MWPEGTVCSLKPLVTFSAWVLAWLELCRSACGLKALKGSGLPLLRYPTGAFSCFLDGISPDEADPWICADNPLLNLELGDEGCAYPR